MHIKPSEGYYPLADCYHHDGSACQGALYYAVVIYVTVATTMAQNNMAWWNKLWYLNNILVRQPTIVASTIIMLLVPW